MEALADPVARSLPGTEVAFENEVEYEPALGFLPNFGKKLGEKLARFRQLNKEQPQVHHDALEFPGGQIVLLTRLYPGQQLTVLQLPKLHARRRKWKSKSVLLSSPNLP